jgi:DeoR family transcriptional regulator, fructose operon transcriptional repressor
MSVTADKRRELIIQELEDSQLVRVSDLTERFGISEVSIRHDLDRLEQLGLLKRVHGGAVAVPRLSLGSSHAAKMGCCVDEKERIGRAAAALIQEGDRLIFDSGTTVLDVARSIPGDLLNSGNLTVITASVPIVRELGSWKGVHLILLGGIYLPAYEIVVGPLTTGNLEGLHADKAFLGTDGLTFSHGVTTANLLEAEVDHLIVRAASQRIVVSDSSKIGVIGLTMFLSLNEIDILITDTKAPPDFVNSLEQQGVQVILA